MQLAALVGGYVERIDAATPLTEAAQWMVSRKVGSLVVTREGRVKGIFTEHDLTRATAQHALMERDVVGDWMSEYPYLAAPDWTLEQAADVMVENGIRHLPIMDAEGELTGMVSIKDLVWAWRGPTVEE